MRRLERPTKLTRSMWKSSKRSRRTGCFNNKRTTRWMTTEYYGPRIDCMFQMEGTFSLASSQNFIGHPRYQKMISAVKRHFFWPKLKSNIAMFIAKCQECHLVKAKHQHPSGLLQPFPIPEWKWEVIIMDFTTGLPKRKKQNDSIFVVIDKLSKATHFILVKSTYKVVNIANIFLKDIFRLHGIPKAIISNRVV